MSHVKIYGTLITLRCYELGSASSFIVNIGLGNDIEDLKKIIKNEKLINIADDYLKLWGVNITSISDVSDEMLNEDNELKDPRGIINDAFFYLDSNKVQVLFKVSGK